MELINLHTNSEYTFLSSTIKLDLLIDFAKKNKLSALALTDLNNMFGVPKFYKLCKESGIKPIIGLEIVAEDFHFILLAKNYKGYQHLCVLSSKKMHNQNVVISELENDNIIIIDHPDLGYFVKNKKQLNLKNYYIVANDPNISNAVWVQHRNVLNSDEQVYLVELAKIRGVEYQPQDLYNFDQWSEKIDKQIIERTNNLVADINVEFPKPFLNLPSVVGLENLDPNIELKRILRDAFKSKEEELRNFSSALKRLDFEYRTIRDLDFSNYFLLIWDFLKWAREQKILIGPGRGSSSGSLVSYLLDITQVNPLKYDLLFERFLNPMRITMPDIDIDIQDTRRNEIINYIQQKYGFEHTATIVTFSTLGARSVFRDISRNFGISETEINQNSKLIKMGQTLKECYNEKKSNFRTLIETPNENGEYIYKQIYEISTFLEGMPRQSGTHAAGIVISKEPLTNLVPTLLSREGYNQVQFSAEFLEEFSLLKIDLLGLRNLNIVSEILHSIQEDGKKIDFEDLPLSDEKTNKLLSQGFTKGIFQLESPGMSSTIKGVGVDSFNDVVATISLFRPGPIKQISVYKERKNQKIQWEKIHPDFDKIIESTYGIIIYQEQIMQICQTIAGFDLAQADLIRIAISKKDEKKMSEIKELFIQNAVKKGHNINYVKQIYDLILKFAAYGFNKAHATAYATLAYKMAFLKSRYPVQFYCYLISNENGNQANIEKYVKEVSELKYKIIPPNVNKSLIEAFYDKKSQSIILPLIMIKQIGEVAAKSLIEERQTNGDYQGFIDFVLRMKLINFSIVNIEKLIKANALSDFGNQQTLLANLQSVLQFQDYVFYDENKKIKIDIDLINSKFQMNQLDFDLKESLKNEYDFLGMNFIETPKPRVFANQPSLQSFHRGVEYSVILKLFKMEHNKTKAGADTLVLHLTDLTDKIKVWVFGSRIDYFKSLKVNKTYKLFLTINQKNMFSFTRNEFIEVNYE